MPGKSLVIALAVGSLLLAPAGVLAQVPQAGSAGAGPAAINGIPLGPASVGGQNNSVYDPSGIGNAARAPSAPSGVTGAYTTLSPVSPVVTPGRAVYPSRRTYERGTTKLSKREQKLRIKENDRLLNGKLTSICRGC
jgi:hypothetical protein